ncbi:hypothetical protein Tco_1426787 [Tanacetum coccineum]
MRAIIKEEVNSQLPQILPQAVLEFVTPVIEWKHKSYLRADYKRELYDALVKSYNTNKHLFDTYGEVFLLKRSRDNKDKDQDPSTGSDRGMKRRKSSKDAESSRDPKSKESKSTSSSKGTSNIKFDMGNNDEQPDDEAISKSDWYKKPEQSPTPTSSQTWITNLAHAEKPPTSFDELMDTPIDFSAFVMNQLNITNLTQELLFASNKMSSKDVYSIKHIIAVTSLKIMKRYDYGHLDEIEVRREDQQLYKFKEDEHFNLNVALRMFTRRIVIQRLVEDLQLAVESYQKKLNPTKPDIFSDGALNNVRTALHDITSEIRMEYLPKRKWSGLDKRRARVMI